ncbi:MAG: hypothetical protein NTV54_16330 [Ignavibacteriales bacterium]|nr:hypothetical protein [Ignavibacteriales bacterium]
MNSWNRAYSVFIHVFLASALAAIAILLVENARLRSNSPKTNHVATIAEGDTLAGFDAFETHTGNAISLPDSLRLFFFFKASCPLCREVFPVWNRIADSLTGIGIYITGISFDSESESPAEPAHFPTGRLNKPRDFALLNRLFSVPTTALTDRRMKIIRIWQGLVDPALCADIIRASRSFSARQ